MIFSSLVSESEQPPVSGDQSVSVCPFSFRDFSRFDLNFEIMNDSNAININTAKIIFFPSFIFPSKRLSDVFFM